MKKLLGKAKNMWRSWTIWFNGVGIAIIGFWPDLVSNFPTLQGYVSEGVFKSQNKVNHQNCTHCAFKNTFRYIALQRRKVTN